VCILQSNFIETQFLYFYQSLLRALIDVSAVEFLPARWLWGLAATFLTAAVAGQKPLRLARLRLGKFNTHKWSKFFSMNFCNI
jgi:hypothetical protein